MFPVFKKTLLPIVKKEQSIEISLNRQVTEIDDIDGSIYQLINSLDGITSIDEIAVALQTPIEEVSDAIDSLNSLGYIEDGKVPVTYSQIEQERYRSNLNYFSGYSHLGLSKYEIQDKLRNKKVAILGLGGGCLVASYLAGLGVGEIIGLDFDTVERSNLNRQFLYNEEDIGRLKSEVAKERIQKINPDVKITSYNLEISCYEDLLPILSGADVVISMIDQPAYTSTRWVNAACVKLQIPYYSGGVNHQHIKLERSLVSMEEPCYDCKLIHMIRSNPDSLSRLRTFYNSIMSNVNTGFAPNISLLTGLITLDITKLLTSISPLSKPIIDFNITTLALEQWEQVAPKLPNCPTCSGSFEVLPTLDDLIIAAEREGNNL